MIFFFIRPKTWIIMNNTLTQGFSIPTKMSSKGIGEVRMVITHYITTVQ